MLFCVLLCGAPDKAAAARRTIKRRPVDKSAEAAAWLSEAYRLRMSGAPRQEVLARLESALDIDPLHANAHYNRGVTLSKVAAPLEEVLACFAAAIAIGRCTH